MCMRGTLHQNFQILFSGCFHSGLASYSGSVGGVCINNFNFLCNFQLFSSMLSSVEALATPLFFTMTKYKRLRFILLFFSFFSCNSQTEGKSRGFCPKWQLYCSHIVSEEKRYLSVFFHGLEWLVSSSSYPALRLGVRLTHLHHRHHCHHCAHYHRSSRIIERASRTSKLFFFFFFYWAGCAGDNRWLSGGAYLRSTSLC